MINEGKLILTAISLNAASKLLILMHQRFLSNYRWAKSDSVNISIILLTLTSPQTQMVYVYLASKIYLSCKVITNEYFNSLGQLCQCSIKRFLLILRWKIIWCTTLMKNRGMIAYVLGNMYPTTKTITENISDHYHTYCQWDLVVSSLTIVFPR